MATQFTIYKSTDTSAPTLAGTAGSLIALLKACLVDGYGAKAAPSPAWTQPIATASNIGSFRPGAGSQMAIVVNDNGPNVTSTYKEAWVTGWESVAGVGAPVGSGSGQFPTPAQLLTSGHVVWRKSTTADGTARAWTIFADSYSCYVFIQTGDSASTYFGYFFGDFYSLKSTTDTYRAILIGRDTENSAAAPTAGAALTVDAWDSMAVAANNSGASSMTQALPGHFCPRTVGGGGTSITMGKHGDSAKAGPFSSGAAVTPMPYAGLVQTPNSADNSFYLSPIWVTEAVGALVRGRMRGLYQVCHPSASFTDGHVFSGGGDFAGKTFQVVRPFIGTGYFALETSATVEVN